MTVLKFFIDTANLGDIRRVADMGILSGVTTTPNLVAREGEDVAHVLKQIASIVDGPVSAGVVRLDAVGIVEEALSLADLHKNIIITVPMTVEGVKAVHQLALRGIRSMATLVFSASQALVAARAGAAFVSPFMGRLDDIGIDSVKLISEIAQIYDMHGISTEIVAASIRHPIHMTQAAMAGAHIATAPYLVFEQMIKHPLTDRGIERVLADWSSIQKK